MIVHPPPQQLCPFHLIMAVFILALTAYPYLFYSNNVRWSVAAYSNEDLDIEHNLIEKFDIIESSDIIWSKSISTRDTAKQQLHELTNELSDAIPQQTLRKLQFSSLGKTYKLILTQPNHLITEDFTVTSIDGDGISTQVPYSFEDVSVLDGYVEGDLKSQVTVSFNKKDNLTTAQIKTGLDNIIVEPTYLHKDSLTTAIDSQNNLLQNNSKLYDNTMIVYNLRDHKHFSAERLGELDNSTFTNIGKLCPGLNMGEYSNQFNRTSTTKDETTSDLEDIFKIYKPKSERRKSRSIEYLMDSGREKTRCTLHLVADYLFYKYIGKGDLQTTINYLLALINRVNQIYLPTVWESGDERADRFSNIGFTVLNISIHQEYTRISSSGDHYNMQTSRVWTARDFLDNFSQHSPPRQYCLAHLLTYRQFDSPVLGLAYVASTRVGTIGGICSPTQQKGDMFYKHNTGISTSRGISGETLITRQADLVVAHELGHNLGAEHDSSECRPAPSDGGAYLMHPFAVMGFEKNNKFLSNCSRLSIGRVIRRKAPTCFVAVVDHVCGNGIVEDDEECDGGGIGHGHTDPCCDSSCRFTPGSQCSERHSLCCSKCTILSAGVRCRAAEEYNCKQASVCDGSSADCPEAPPVDDESVCVGRGVCRKGECKPFCEARGLYSCLCNTPDHACRLCCKTSQNSTCAPFDIKSPYLPDGLLCYRGVCEKGRCEQPIQDFVERLWDVIEDINFTTFVKFLRDNIILVVLAISIPIWCIFSHYINEFDKRIKTEVINALARSSKNRKNQPSPFLPRLFVSDDFSNSAYDDINIQDSTNIPLKPPHWSTGTQSTQSYTNGSRNGQSHQLPGFRAPGYGFKLPIGEQVAFDTMNNLGSSNGTEPPYQLPTASGVEHQQDNNNEDEEEDDQPSSYSTQV